MGNDASLRGADSTARKEVKQQPVGEAASACPLKSFVIEVLVVGMDGAPLGDVGVQLTDGDAKAVPTRTNSTGVARLTGLEEKGYKLSLYELDRGAWEEVETQDLPTPSDTGGGAAPWQKAQTAPALPPAHEAVQGDCIANIAATYGYFPDDIWNHADNAQLKSLRKNPNVLSPGDRVRIPPRTKKEVEIRAGKRIKLRRKGVPETFKVRFETRSGEPRRGLDYLLQIETASKAAVPDVSGKLDDDGYLTARIPPDATSAKVTLRASGSAQVYAFSLGHVDPIEKLSGVKSRLAGLGYDCGPADSPLDERTRTAIRRFEKEHGLSPTGEPTDAAFVDALQKNYES